MWDRCFQHEQATLQLTPVTPFQELLLFLACLIPSECCRIQRLAPCVIDITGKELHSCSVRHYTVDKHVLGIVVDRSPCCLEQLCCYEACRKAANMEGLAVNMVNAFAACMQLVQQLSHCKLLHLHMHTRCDAKKQSWVYMLQQDSRARCEKENFHAC